MARSSSGGFVIHSVLSVLWMKSCLAVMERMAYFNTRVEFDVYECIVQCCAAENLCWFCIGFF